MTDTEPGRVPFARPFMGDAEIQAAARPIRAGWVTQGPEVAAFEEEFAAALGSPYACAVSSCTTALHLALMVVGVVPGSEVVTVSHSYIAGANSVRHCGALPVFVDVEPGTFNMDPDRLADAIGPLTRAVLVVHQMGMPADLRAILEVAGRRGVPVVEDAACAVGSELQWGSDWERIGRPRGDVACFSFHPRKVLSTGDGGMLTTARGDWDGRFRLLRHHGMTISDAERHGSARVVFEGYAALGFNYRMTDIQAAVGRVQLGRLGSLVEQRRLVAARYGELLSRLPVALPREPAWARSNWQSYCIRLPTECDQRGVMQRLLDAGIATRRGVMCAHREAAYPTGTWRCGAPLGSCGGRPGGCPHLLRSEEAQDHCVLLPLFHEITASQQQHVADALADAIEAEMRGS